MTSASAAPGADRAPVQDASPAPAPASVHDRRTLTSLPPSPPAAPEPPAAYRTLVDAPPAPWAGPADGTGAPSPASPLPPAPAPQANPFAAPAPTPQPESFPRPAPAPNPFAPPAGEPTAQAAYPFPHSGPAPAPNPFAPPAPGPAAQAHPFAQPVGPEPVPPPPIAPDGPGQVPAYGYPGTVPAYGYPGPPHAPYAAAPYPAGNGYGWPGMQAAPSNGMGTASLVLGILSDICFLAWPLALVLGVLAIIFGALGRGKAKRGEATNPGVALAGLICGATGVVLVLIVFAVLIAVLG
ncbi:DUF4190 domain-containing protein [Streptomyces sp. CSDS2]|uniref:DUF4190 domain-containing protein n=1 Tax=Streptomyces sp. CSDS2 TaxID=3055051 RepID=UPI0025B1E589|nr:DUF4190 domain-containing protein [Streptomyces sp. CSDS2]MDN3262919.1 DUF4190 domain-containing protein [Streptomyces sp. CSDS2]